MSNVVYTDEQMMEIHAAWSHLLATRHEHGPDAKLTKRARLAWIRTLNVTPGLVLEGKGKLVGPVLQSDVDNYYKLVHAINVNNARLLTVRSKFDGKQRTLIVDVRQDPGREYTITPLAELIQQDVDDLYENPVGKGGK